MNDFPFACVHFGLSRKDGFSQGPGKRSVNWNVLLEPQPVLYSSYPLLAKTGALFSKDENRGSLNLGAMWHGGNWVTEITRE